MGHEQQAAVPLVDGHRQAVNRLHVQVVGGLVQQQHVRRLVRQPRKHDARLEPVGQLLHRQRLRGAAGGRGGRLGGASGCARAAPACPRRPAATVGRQRAAGAPAAGQ